MITIKHFVGLKETPAVYMGHAAYIELAGQGWAQRIFALHWSYNCFVAFDDGYPVGVIVYEDRKASMRDVWIMLSYVVPHYRGYGVFRLLWDAMVTKAQELEVVAIRSMTHPQNKVMRAIGDRIGRVEEGVQMRFDVPAKPQADIAIARVSPAPIKAP